LLAEHFSSLEDWRGEEEELEEVPEVGPRCGEHCGIFSDLRIAAYKKLNKAACSDGGKKQGQERQFAGKSFVSRRLANRSRRSGEIVQQQAESSGQSAKD